MAQGLATIIQKVFRGFQGRAKYHRRLIELAVKHKAASMIQAIYRGAKVSEGDMKGNLITQVFTVIST